MAYDGFISYSHAADGELAPALQQGLQRLTKPWYRRRALEVFRDETGLSVDPHLWGAIVEALDDADWFVLLTSPQAAASSWVNREIEHWKANRSVDRILPVVTDGTWEWDPARGDFTEESWAVPPALRGVFEDEPRHLDLRWAREEEQLDLRNGRFRDAVAELAAPIHGRTKDDLEGEDVRQHRRTVRVAWGAAIALALLAMAAVLGAGLAVRNADRAEQRRIEADAQRLAAQSQTELERADLAFLLAAHGYRLDPGVPTESALLTAVANLPEIKQRIRPDAPVTAVATSAAADRVWIGTAAGDVLAHRFSDGERVAASPGRLADEVLHLAPADADGDTVVATDGITVATLDADLEPVTTRPLDTPALALAVEPGGGRIAAGGTDGSVLVWAPDEEEPSRLVGVPDTDEDLTTVTALAWEPGGGLVVAGQDGAVRRYDPGAADEPSWVQEETTSPGAWVSALAVVDDGTVVTGGTDGTVGFWAGADGAPADGGLNPVHTAEVTGLAATGDAAEAGSVASVAEDGFVVYWNHLTGIPLSTPLAPIQVDVRAATSVAWDPAEPLHGVTGGLAGGALLIDYSDEQRQPVAAPRSGWTDAATVALSPDGERLAVARGDGRLTLTDPDAPDPDDPSVTVDGVIERLAFTPDGGSVLAATGEGLVAAWDGKADAATVTEVAPGEAVAQLAVSPDGTTVATGSLELEATAVEPGTVRLWRLRDGELVEEGGIDGLPPFGFGLAFTPDGERLVVGGTDELVVHDLDAADGLEIPIDGDASRSLAVSPDGASVAVGLTSGPVRLFDLETGEATGDDLGVAGRVTELGFLDEGQVLVTVSEDGGFVLWDVESRRRFSDRVLTAVDRNAAGAAPLAPSLGLAPDLAYTASIADGRLVRWSLEPDDWVAEGCALHRRELTEAERERFDLEGADPVCAGD